MQPELPDFVKPPMKRLLILALPLCFGGALSAATLQETFDRTLAVRPGTQFVLSNVNGRITLGAWDQPQVRIHALKKVEGHDPNELKTLLQQTRIDITQNDAGVHVITRVPHRDLGFLDLLTGSNVNTNVTYEVTLPRTMNVTVDNTNGAIEIAEVHGALKLETTNGRIHVTRCAGHVDASTTNGSITAELLQVTGAQPMSLETTNGRISVALPANFGARLSAETSNGSITSELPIATNHFDKHEVHGVIGAGGPELRLRTTNGRIEITKAN
jgi:DUF4097 and DUF4098 domain-containing protein YvlB